PSMSSLIDTVIYNSYNIDDLRKQIFYLPNIDGSFSFRGSYFGGIGWLPYCGIAVDEMFLIRAECSARAGMIDSAMSDLNKLLITRWKSVSGVTTYINMTASSSHEALQFILGERKKELIFRGTRWSDLRRLNLE